MPKQRATAILIVGMHRSGTSALAGVLGKLGIPLGKRLLEPGSDNPKGYWEHRDIVVVHDRLLEALGSRWDDVRALPDNWLSSEPARRAGAALEDILARDFGGSAVWAVKDPRLCRFLPLWIEVLGRMEVNPALLFIARDPDEVSASIEARNHWRRPLGEMLWLRSMTEAIEASAHANRQVVLFEDLLADPVATALEALRQLDIPIPEQSAANTRESVEGFVDKADRHHRRRDGATASHGFAAIARGMYDTLAEIARGQHAWAKLGKSIAEYQAEWERIGPAIEAVANMAMGFAADVRAKDVECSVVESQLNAQIAWSEQAKKKIETLQAENADLSSKLTAQIAWSEQEVKKCESLQAGNADLSSKLSAQIAWSEQAQANIDALRAESMSLSSMLKNKTSQMDSAEKELGNARTANDDLAQKLRRAIDNAERTRNELRAIHASRSWRMLKPLRSVADFFGSTKSTRDENDKRDSE